MKYSLFLPLFILAIAATSCNDDSKSQQVWDESGYYSVMVNSFSLEKNDSVMQNLDSVFFSIDLDAARIFNADSLPVGTKVNALVVKISLPAVKEAKLYVPHANSTKVDTIDYTTNSTDSIDFSTGSVKLHLVSANGEVSRDYEIFVNVHRVNPSILSWSQTSQKALPTSLSEVKDFGVAETPAEVVVLTSDGVSYSVATSSDPYSGQWVAKSAACPAQSRLATLRNVGETLYMLTDDDHLWLSSDYGESWSDTGATMSWLYGANGDNLLGIRNDGGSYRHYAWPSGIESDVDPACPVTGTSQTAEYVSAWSPNPLTLMAGGVTASNDTVGTTWAYEGGQWAEISQTSLPDMTGITLFPYFTGRVGSIWVATDRTTLFALGGKKSDGSLNDETYISRDRGLHWSKGGSNLKLPDEIGNFYGAFAVVRPQTLGSRASQPITSWDCPFVYLFGGYDAAGTLFNSSWRGVINQLKFKPIQ